MSNKLKDKDLSLIMSYVDGQLDPSKTVQVEKLISENIEAKMAFEDLKLSSSFYGGYVSNIKENSEKIISKNKNLLEKGKKSFLSTIFQKPIRNFIAYPIAAVFIFTLGFQMNSVSFRGIDQDNEQFRGIENSEDINERIKYLEKEVFELKAQIDNYIKEIEKLNKRLKENN